MNSDHVAVCPRVRGRVDGVSATSRHRSAQAPAVQITMEGVCIMLDEKPDWPTAKKVLGDSQFLQNLKTYDKDNIPEPTIKKLQKYINDENMQVSDSVLILNLNLTWSS